MRLVRLSPERARRFYAVHEGALPERPGRVHVVGSGGAVPPRETPSGACATDRSHRPAGALAGGRFVPSTPRQAEQRGARLRLARVGVGGGSVLFRRRGGGSLSKRRDMQIDLRRDKQKRGDPASKWTSGGDPSGSPRPTCRFDSPLHLVLDLDRRGRRSGSRGKAQATARQESVAAASSSSPRNSNWTSTSSVLRSRPFTSRAIRRWMKKMAGVHFHDGRTLSIDAEIREAVILALSMQPLCREDCKGLCAQCGEDRNAGPLPLRARPRPGRGPPGARFRRGSATRGMTNHGGTQEKAFEHPRQEAPDQLEASHAVPLALLPLQPAQAPPPGLRALRLLRRRRGDRAGGSPGFVGHPRQRPCATTGRARSSGWMRWEATWRRAR